MALPKFAQTFLPIKDIHNHGIILPDGEKLVELMIVYNAGVQVESTYKVKSVDEYFFELVYSE